MKKRYFTLLEVLIAIMLITASLPLLLSVYVYATIDQKEALIKIKQERAAFHYLTIILTELQTGAISLNQLDSEQEYPLKTTSSEYAATGSYRFSKLRPQKDQEGEQVELWQMKLKFEDKHNEITTQFPFEFIVRRNKPVEASPES